MERRRVPRKKKLNVVVYDIVFYGTHNRLIKDVVSAAHVFVVVVVAAAGRRGDCGFGRGGVCRNTG